MSFKRDGDDSGWLLTLQKRRVSELFASEIPPDEAFLTKNGSIACLVCTHRPVFDTINMLAVHRNGKKHIHNCEYFYKKKRELEELKERRRHEQYCEDGLVAAPALMEHSVSKHPLLTSDEYSSRVRPHKLKPYERKLIVDLDLSQTQPSNKEDVKSVDAGLRPYRKTTPITTRNLTNFQTESKHSGSVKRAPVLSSDCISASSSSRASAVKHAPGVSSDCIIASSSSRASAVRVKQILYSVSSHERGSCAAAYHRRRLERGAGGGGALVKLSSSQGHISSQQLPVSVGPDCNQVAPLRHISSQQLPVSVGPDCNQVAPLRHIFSQQLPVSAGPDCNQAAPLCDRAHRSSTHGDRSDVTEARGVSSDTTSTERTADHRKCAAAPPTERTRLYLQAISDGWKRSNDGSWIKDDIAEFDSDEETPTVV